MRRRAACLLARAASLPASSAAAAPCACAAGPIAQEATSSGPPGLPLPRALSPLARPRPQWSPAIERRALFSSSSSAGGAAHPHPPPLEQRLLDAALAHVPAHGWSRDALEAGARDLGLSPAAAGLLPRGEGQLVEAFIGACNDALAAQLAGGPGPLAARLAAAGDDERARLHAALRTRLEMLAPHVASWPQALALAAQPRNLPHALALGAAMVDAVAGALLPPAAGADWYSQRAALAAAYAAAEAAMLVDASEGFAETWTFLDRRLADAEALRAAGDGAAVAAAGLLRSIFPGVPRPGAAAGAAPPGV
jgi:ubiquinone biosynthesis protein COQ9